MVSLGWLNELGETSTVFAPVELSTVNYHTSNRGAVATDPLCCTVDDNVGTVVNGTNKVTTRTKGVVDLEKGKLHFCMLPLGTYHNRNTLLMGNFSDGFEIGDIVTRVSN